MSHPLLRSFCAACLAFVFTACSSAGEQGETGDSPTRASHEDGAGIQQALSAMNGVSVLSSHRDGTPDFIKGTLGRASGSARGLTAADAKATVHASLESIAPVYGLAAEDLVFRRMSVDENGHQHLRFSQWKDGLPVIDGELVLHVDRAGVVYAANGSARDTRSPGLARVQPRLSAQDAATVALDATAALTREGRTERLVYVRDANDQLVLAHEVRVTGLLAAGVPMNDLVYVKASDGGVVRRSPRIFNALNRDVYSANNGSSLPGTLARVEGEEAVSDPVVNACYDTLGTFYDCLHTLFGRDSYDSVGATLTCSTHYLTTYVGAFWNGTQLVCGDGDGTSSTPLCNDPDIVAHELAHAVTIAESDLAYSGESGGLNESFSDVIAATCESWTRGFVLPDADVWKIGEDVWTPGTAGDAVRYMNDPVLGGGSVDYYPNYSPNMDVHFSSGIPNLAFSLLSTGGTHPRGRTSVVVPGIGVEKAARIFYKANADIWTASTTFAQAKTYTEQAAQQLGYDPATVDAVSAAWQAVGVGVSIPPPTPIPLTNGVAVTGLAGSMGGSTYYKLTVPPNQTSLVFTTSGGTGDVDLYVKFGSVPTTSSYDCRPFVSGNNETCTINNPAAGDWYVMLDGYSAYSGVSLTGTYRGVIIEDNFLLNGVASAPYSGARNAWYCKMLNVPAGRSVVTFNQVGVSGTTGDADLYVRFGSTPTLSLYNCRPNLAGSTEKCTINNPAAGTWFVCSYGYTAYTNVTMKGTY
ncbi:M4 family metallopeptidase [Pyxidicoccus parkwayensis]|uniref:M4 family metallopeptidase n=1 Tax=Pyxidicoccus parkwayensis TaxID=2813578 RepID=A0ABX7P2L9_9BACT|nr:M4 family metallopeptidase [Pyxidicoccus parkwaysis]